MAELTGRTILVTGGSGFLGSHLCRQLCASGSRVIATSRHAQATDIDGLRWLTPDLEDEDAVRALLSSVRPDVIYHLAGEVSAAPDAERVLPMFRSLLGSTVNLLSAALEQGMPRVILAGSLTEPDKEGERPLPTSPYAAAKWAASGYARMFEALYDLPTVILRPYMVYGPAQKAEKLVPYVIGCCLRGEGPKLSSGHQRADWIYVEDVVEGMIAAASSPQVLGQTLDLGSGQLTAARELVGMIVELTGCATAPAFGALPDRPLESERVADLALARDLLDWSPRTPLREGLSRTIESFRAKRG